MSHNAIFETTNEFPLKGEEPGSVYTANLETQITFARLRRKNIQLKKQLRFIRICAVILWFMFIGVCVFSCIVFNEYSRKFDDLSKAYEEIIDAQTNNTNKDLINHINPTTPSNPHSTKDNADSIVNNSTNTNENSEDEVKEFTFPEMFDFIPLDDELKEYIYTSAIEANIPAEVVFSLAWTESTYRPNVESTTSDHGLFQINEINFERFAEKYGYTYEEFCKKIYDPYVNTDCMIIILTECRDYYNNDNWHHVLMRYNLGPGRTNELFSEGIYSSSHSRTVLNYAEETFGFTDIELK